MANPLLRVCLGDLSPAEQAALEDDLTLAARIQSELLPRRELRFDGWEVFTYYQPASVVSGDYCDVVTPETAGGELLFLIGDIAGHGVAASMLMAHLHAIFRSLMDVDAPVNKLVERANRVFAQSTISSYFATLVCGRANPTGEVELCNAGHNPPLLIGAGPIRSIWATGLPIGLFNFGQYSLTRVRLAPDEALFLYTDGLTEAQNPAGEQYSMGRLEGLVGSLGVRSPEAILRACLEDWNAFRAGASQQDDLTLMVIRRVA
jgi:sigma-B regulation protein RsbU (phosphoserine phosphatase)